MKKSEFVKQFDKLRRTVDNQYNPKKKLMTWEFTEKMSKFLSMALGKKNISQKHKQILEEHFGEYANGKQVHGRFHSRF